MGKRNNTSLYNAGMAWITPEVTQYPAAADLAPYVHRFMHGVSAQPGELRIPPTGGVFVSYVCGSPLLVQFDDRVYDKKTRWFLGGQLRQQRPLLRSEAHFELIGAELTPTGYYKLFHQYANALTDSIRDLAATHAEAALVLEKCIGDDSHADVRQRIAAMEQGLRTLAANTLKAPLVDAVVAEISRCNGNVRMTDVYRKQAVTARQIRRNFERVVGISPKHYAKICQVNAVINAMLENDSERLRSLALDHGFFDQAHFIHDFRRFVAMDPGAFLRDDSQFLRTYLGNASRHGSEQY